MRIGVLCGNMGIDIKLYTSHNLDDGYSTIIDGKPTIYINSNAAISRQRFTAAHELGHILLGHVGEYQLINREPDPRDNPIETAANIFASRLLAPACVLWGCNAKTVEDIMKLCDISRKAAEYRIERMKDLYKINKFFTSNLEKQVYEQFKDYIKKNKL
ncbi:MAG: ImmA/IrrE family metallo-endopeptidase [Lachnospiraceae bacterium]|nr:ImmA/IrrE family metallo-endopeptidase [Lachnospiraceae bacterium]